MFQPTVQILYDSEHCFSELVFAFNTKSIRDYTGVEVRRTLIPRFLNEHVLLQSKEAQDALMAAEVAGVVPMVACSKLVITNCDRNLVPLLIGYFWERDQQTLADSFPILAFYGSGDSKKAI